MCGILGCISGDKLNNKLSLELLQMMKRRGPDSQIKKNFKIFNRNVAFFHSRLSIIDLNHRSDQPYFFDDLVLIFNGEIYNYLELKNELKSLGYNFKTQGDAEVLIKYYHKFGDEAFKKFNGMWSLAILNKKKGYIKLSRDSFGEKPMFYYKDKEKFIFGSEIKFLRKALGNKVNVNLNKLKKSLLYGYKILNYDKSTFYNSIYKIKPNSIYKFDIIKNKFDTKKINNLQQVNNYYSKNLQIEEFEKIFLDNLKLKLRADVPLGFCLSGGIDSALIVSMATNILNKSLETFSIVDGDKRYNETKNIEIINRYLNSNSNIINLDRKNFLSKLIEVTNYSDAPIATISYFVHSLLLKEMKKKQIKVSFSGTGADEIFTGYYHHYNLFLYQNKNNPNFTKTYNDWKKNISILIRDEELKNLNLFNKKFLNQSVYYESKKIEKIIKKKTSFKIQEKKYFKDKLKNRMQNELLHEIVPVILYHDDINSMNYSIENRSPYLDKTFLEIGRSLKNDQLISSNFQKLPLRKLATKYLPKKIYSDNRKIGFNASINSLINTNSNELKEFILDTKSKSIFEILDKRKVEKILKSDHYPNYLSKFLFSTITSVAFLENN